ncbi:MAG TPA: dTMP kinase [Candidatus Thermoplasmatota archaeon]|nr:dTMP kinase [Candidatus Thermoplasmatota archaeon]
MNHFFTFEGIDGSGKSTIIKQVATVLKQKEYQVVTTFEPTDTWLGKYVQHQIKTKSDPFVTAFTFIADRIEHSKQIQEWIDQGNIVLCDRYAESTYAYQSVQLEKTLKNPINWLQDLSKSRILNPDRTFYFQITPEKALSRIQHRDELIFFEQQSFLRKVYNNYEHICKGDRFIQVDATKSIPELTELCLDKILSES